MAPATINDFLGAIHTYSNHAAMPPEDTISLVMAVSGGFAGANDPDIAAMQGQPVLKEVDDITAYEAWLRDWFQLQADGDGQTEADVVRSAIQGVDTFFEKASEDQAGARQRARAEQAYHQSRLADPEQVDAVIAEMNDTRWRLAETLYVTVLPEVTRENVLECLEQLYAEFPPKASLAQMQQDRLRLDLWRSATAPLLNDSAGA